MKNFHHQFFLIIIFTSLKSFQTAYILPTMSSIVVDYEHMCALTMKHISLSNNLSSSVNNLSSSVNTLSHTVDTLSDTNAKLVTTNNALTEKFMVTNDKLEEAKDALAKLRQTKTQTKTQTKPCKFFWKEEGCRRGDKCNFMHSREVSSTGSQDVYKPSTVHTVHWGSDKK